jgi:hypothetical protein
MPLLERKLAVNKFEEQLLYHLTAASIEFQERLLPLNGVGVTPAQQSSSASVAGAFPVDMN